MFSFDGQYKKPRTVSLRGASKTVIFQFLCRNFNSQYTWVYYHKIVNLNCDGIIPLCYWASPDSFSLKELL